MAVRFRQFAWDISLAFNFHPTNAIECMHSTRTTYTGKFIDRVCPFRQQDQCTNSTDASAAAAAPSNLLGKRLPLPIVPLPASPWPTHANNAKLSYRSHFLFPMVAVRMKTILPFDFKCSGCSNARNRPKMVIAVFFLLLFMHRRLAMHSTHTHTKHTHAEPIACSIFIFCQTIFFLHLMMTNRRTDGRVYAFTHVCGRMQRTRTHVCARVRVCE